MKKVNVKVSKEQIEELVLEKLNEVKDILEDNGYPAYLNMHMHNDWITFNNRYWADGKDKSTPINYLPESYNEDL